MAYLRALDRESLAWSLVAALLYLLALTAKEVYVPLPFLLVALPQGTFRARIRSAAPLLGSLLAFAAWRAHMLGGLMGGYDESSERLSAAPGRIAALLASLPRLLFAGCTRLETIALASVAVAAVLLLAKRPRLLALLTWAVVLVLLPLVPVADAIQTRYLFLPWAAVAVTAALMLGWSFGSGGAGRGFGIACAGLVAVIALRANRRAWIEGSATAVRSTAESTFFFRKSIPGDVLRQPLESEWLFGGLRWLRKNVEHRGDAGAVVYDDWALCVPEAAGTPPPRLFEFSASSGAVEERPGLAGRIRATCRDGVRPDAALDVHLTYDGRFVRWRLGPYPDGSWSFLTGGTFARYDFPRAGTYRLPVSGDLVVTVRYVSPEGWRTYSPPLTLRVAGGRGELDWKR